MVHCVLIVVMVVIRQCGLQLLHHPLYSSNLALSLTSMTYYLGKIHIVGKHSTVMIMFSICHK